MTTSTLYEALCAIPDHRTAKGRRFPLATILVIALAAMLSGANDLMAIFRWGRRLSPKALQTLGADLKRRRAPCHATYHYVFQSISAADLKAALGTLAETEGGLGHVAIDGKRLIPRHISSDLWGEVCARGVGGAAARKEKKNTGQPASRGKSQYFGWPV